MPFIGTRKKEDNFLRYRIPQQKEFWPAFVKEWDKKAEGTRFRSEILSLTDLWNLYVAGVPDDLSDEAVARGRRTEDEEDEESQPAPTRKKKKKHGFDVVPIAARRLPGRYNDDGYLHFDQWLYARDQARKELFFLCKELGFVPDVATHIHQVVCDQFVQPDFDGVYKEGYTLKDFTDAVKKQNRVPRVWLETKPYEKQTLGDFGHYILDPVESDKPVNYARTMLLLDPRGFFKTWIDVANVVQLVINAPDSRILLMSGVYKLTVDFLLMIKAKFYLPRGSEPKLFHLLFPEFVIRGVDGTSRENLRIKESCEYLGSRLEHDPAGATVGIISIGSALSGNHCEFLKFDDIVTDNNCNTPETREALKDKANGAVNLMMEWSWHDIIGTRYFPDDYYGQTEDNFKKTPDDFNLKYFKRAAWTVKPEYQKNEDSNIFDLKEHMVDLTWPEHRSFAALRKMLAENVLKFRCQQLNQPVWGDEGTVKFTREQLEKHRDKGLLETLAMPGKIFGAIDLARESKQFSDFTALVVGKVYQEGAHPSLNPFSNPFTVDEVNPFSEQSEGKIILVILDLQFGKWSQTEIATRIAAMHDKWRPKYWIGEEIGGLSLLKEKIAEVSKTTYGHWPYIRWDDPENADSAKRNRIKGVELLLRADRLFFVVGPWNDEVFEQFEKYKGQKSTRYSKDDVPDVVSMLTKDLPSLVPLSKKELAEREAQNQAVYREYVRREMRRQIFGDDSGGFASVLSTFTPFNPPEEPKGPMGNIGNKIFGGNGIRV